MKVMVLDEVVRVKQQVVFRDFLPEIRQVEEWVGMAKG